MRFDWHDERSRWHFRLSRDIPYLLGVHCAAPVRRLLDRHGLRRHDVDHWILHTGGGAVIDAVRYDAGLTEHAVRHTRAVLHDVGNVSSGSFLFSFQRLRREAAAAPGDHGVMMTMARARRSRPRCCGGRGTGHGGHRRRTDPAANGVVYADLPPDAVGAALAGALSTMVGELAEDPRARALVLRLDGTRSGGPAGRLDPAVAGLGPGGRAARVHPAGAGGRRAGTAGPAHRGTAVRADRLGGARTRAGGRPDHRGAGGNDVFDARGRSAASYRACPCTA